MNASQEGHLEVIKLLLNHEALVESKDDKGRTSIFLASQNGHFAIVKLNYFWSTGHLLKPNTMRDQHL